MCIIKYERSTLNKTFFIDLDGTIWPYCKIEEVISKKPEDYKLLPGVREKINKWILEEHKIIFVTARHENNRKKVEAVLEHLCIPYHQLIMNCGMGERIVINDTATNKEMAIGITVERDKGFQDIDI